MTQPLNLRLRAQAKIFQQIYRNVAKPENALALLMEEAADALSWRLVAKKGTPTRNLPVLILDNDFELYLARRAWNGQTEVWADVNTDATLVTAEIIAWSPTVNLDIVSLKADMSEVDGPKAIHR